MTVIESGSSKASKARLGEFDAVEFEEGRGDGMEAERGAFLQHDTGKLAPDFNDEWFGHVVDHGLISWSRPTWCRSDERTTVETVESVEVTSKYRAYGINVAHRFFRAFLAARMTKR